MSSSSCMKGSKITFRANIVSYTSLASRSMTASGFSSLDFALLSNRPTVHDRIEVKNAQICSKASNDDVLNSI